MINNRLAYVILALIVLAFVVTGVLYAVYTPPWQAPDEPAHYNYVAQIVHNGCCPVIQSGDWDSAYLEQLKAAQFPEDADLTSLQYEDHQPPFYYLMAAPVFAATGGDLTALRIFSVILGSGGAVAAYFVVARLLPRHKVLALAAAAFVAFIPQNVAILASVNNDSAAGTLLGIILVVAITYLGNPVGPNLEGNNAPLSESCRPHAAALGGLLGAAFLTKLTLYLPAAAAVAVAILLRWRIEKHPLRWLAWQAVWAGGMALVIGGWWWVRDALVYGWPDILAQNAHNAVVVGQLRTAQEIAKVGLGGYLSEYATTLYHSFWGQFGWMGVPMPPRIYLLIGVFLLLDLAGLVMLIGPLKDRLAAQPVQRAGGWALAAVTLAALVNLVFYNLTFVQFQGRYLFPALIPLGLAAALGLRGWGLLIGRGLKGERWARALEWLPLALLAWLPILALWALFKYIVPNLG